MGLVSFNLQSVLPVLSRLPCCFGIAHLLKCEQVTTAQNSFSSTIKEGDSVTSRTPLRSKRSLSVSAPSINGTEGHLVSGFICKLPFHVLASEFPLYSPHHRSLLPRSLFLLYRATCHLADNAQSDLASSSNLNM